MFSRALMIEAFKNTPSEDVSYIESNLVPVHVNDKIKWHHFGDLSEYSDELLVKPTQI